MSAKGPPIGSLPHITASISSPALRSLCACATGPAKSSAAARIERAGTRLIRHLRAHGTSEVVAAAMHRDNHVRFELLNLGNDLIEVILGRRPEMEAPNDSMDLLHAGDFLCLPDRIDYADVTARADHHEPAVLDIETGRVLVDVLVG